MVSVGVKELKAKLSGFIARAREGEEIVITDHGKDVALIRPLSLERRAVKSLATTAPTPDISASWSATVSSAAPRPS